VLQVARRVALSVRHGPNGEHERSARRLGGDPLRGGDIRRPRLVFGRVRSTDPLIEKHSNGESRYCRKARPLYECYRQWVEGAGENAITETLFGRRLKYRGFSKEHGRYGTAYTGIALRADSDERA
jgi:hypothetical protein